MKKKKWLSLVLLAFPFCGNAQQINDPILMTVNGKPVPRSEFEYSYNKNRKVSDVYEKKTVDEYVDLFVNYRLKVEAAKEARLDTLSSFLSEFGKYRDAQLIPYLIDSVYVDSVARVVYEDIKMKVGDADLVHVAHIFFKVPQRMDRSARDKIRNRADSVYSVLLKGVDFAQTAKRVSEDYATARNGGEIPWFGPNAALPEFEQQAYALKPGQMSKPFLSTVGFHIIRMLDRKKLEPYEIKKKELVDQLRKQGLDELACESSIRKMIVASGGRLTRDDIANQVIAQHEKDNPDLKYLVKEYHDGLLLFEVVSKAVWDKVAEDEAGTEAYFEAHESDYKWESPRFKGFLIQAKDKKQLSKVKKVLKKHQNGDWQQVIKETFNSEKPQVRVLYGIYKEGDNTYVDNLAFKCDHAVESKLYPYSSLYGKKVKKPQSYEDVKERVKSDFQQAEEKKWVESLRKKYRVEVNKEVLRSVNSH